MYVVYIPTFSKDMPLVEYFKYLHRDKIKLVNEVLLAQYVLTPYPTQVLTFGANSDAKKMYIEEFFISVLPKELTTAQEKENILGMAGSKDVGSYILADKLLMTADIWDDKICIEILNNIFRKRSMPYSDQYTFLKKIISYATNYRAKIYNK
jgi:hypothetical protein